MVLLKMVVVGLVGWRGTSFSYVRQTKRTRRGSFFFLFVAYNDVQTSFGKEEKLLFAFPEISTWVLFSGGDKMTDARTVKAPAGSDDTRIFGVTGRLRDLELGGQVVCVVVRLSRR